MCCLRVPVSHGLYGSWWSGFVGNATSVRNCDDMHNLTHHNMHPSGMQLITNALYSLKSSRQRFKQIELISRICTNVRVCWPQQYAVDATIAGRQIVQVSLNGVISLALVERGVVEVAIV